MSLSFILVCEETRQKLWVGQGHHAPEAPHAPMMDTLYTGEPYITKLQQFLNETRGKPLVLAVEDYGEHCSPDWTNFE